MRAAGKNPDIAHCDCATSLQKLSDTIANPASHGRKEQRLGNLNFGYQTVRFEGILESEILLETSSWSDEPEHTKSGSSNVLGNIEALDE
jgi:hypothetical protein